MNYILVVPNGKDEITIGHPHGSITLKNGSIVPKSVITDSYPNLFMPMTEPKVAKQKVEAVAPTMETVTEEAPIKRKAGRPPKKK